MPRDVCVPVVRVRAGAAEVLATLGARKGMARWVGDDLRPVVQGCCYPPGQGHSLGLPPVCCHPCPWTKLLPMSLDRTHGSPNPALQRAAGSRCSPPAAERERYTATRMTPGSA